MRKLLSGLAALGVGLTLNLPAAWATSAPAVSNLTVAGPHGLVTPGTSATYTASATGNGSPVEYECWIQSQAGWRLAAPYSKTNVFHLNNLAPGSDVVVIDALDQNQIAAGAWTAVASFTAILNVGSQVTETVPTTATAGQAITLNADASRLINPVYQWWWENPKGVWHASGNYTTNPGFHWTPHQSGTYRVLVFAKDPLAPNNATDAVQSTVATIKLNPLSLAYGYFHLSGSGSPGRAWYDLQHHTSAISAIAPLWYTLNPSQSQPLSATMPSSTITTVTQFATTHQVAVWPDVRYNGTVAANWWQSHQAATLISQLVNAAKTEGYNGYVLDWEGFAASQANEFGAFVTKLGDTLHQNGLTLTVTVLPAPNSAYAYPTLAQAANYLDLLAYPEYSPSSPSNTAPNPGPTAGYPWVSGAVQSVLAEGINPSQLLLGVSPYGQSWTYTNSGFQSGAIIPDRAIEQSLLHQPGAAVWDPVQQELQITTGTAALVPTAPLTPNPSQFNPAVQNLQFLLNMVLERYQLSHQLPAPLPLATDGGYGPATTAAVEAFQQNYGLNPGTPGVYGPRTASALQNAVTTLGIGNTLSWDENSQAASDLVNMALRNGLAGFSIWRLGYQSPSWWATVDPSVTTQ